MRKLCFGVIFGLCLFTIVSAADDPKVQIVTVKGGDDKEQRIEAPKFLAGFRKVSLSSKSSVNPTTVFVFRSLQSTNYAKGVETWLPIQYLQSVSFEASKQTINVRLNGIQEPLSGSTQFKGINVLLVESGKERFNSLGGKDKTVKECRFLAEQKAPPVEGQKWAIQIDQPKANNPTLVVYNLKVLAERNGVEELANQLPVRRGKPISLAKDQFKQLSVVAVDPAKAIAVEVTNFDKAETTFVIPTATEDPKKGKLVGLMGEVTGGYQFFPWHTIKTVQPMNEMP
jgi:hypothetical protein